MSPAAALLPRPHDDRVEELRRQARGPGALARAARAEIGAILTADMRREWDLLAAAHGAFGRLGLPPMPGAERLAAESRQRLDWALRVFPRPPSRPGSLARRLDAEEHAADLLADLSIRGDARVRERARLAGRVVEAELIGIDQPRPRRYPCLLRIRTNQTAIHMRPGAQISTIDGRLQGRVMEVGEAGTGTYLGVRLTGGVARPLPPPGSRACWTDAVAGDSPPQRAAIYAAMPDLDDPGTQPSASAGTLGTPDDLYAAAEQLRRTGQRP